MPTYPLVISPFSIFAQVNITNPTRWLVKFDVLSCKTYSPTGEYNKTEIFKMAASHSAEVTDKEISEIKTNSIKKQHKRLV
jgi:hypothetical protein